MGYSRSEVMGRAVERKPAPQDRRQMAGAIVQAAVAAANITGNQDWDRFLSFLQASLEDAKKAQTRIQAAILDPRVASHEAFILLSRDAACAAERIRTLEAVIDLPARLIREGAAAKLMLDELESEKRDAAAA